MTFHIFNIYLSFRHCGKLQMLRSHLKIGKMLLETKELKLREICFKIDIVTFGATLKTPLIGWEVGRCIVDRVQNYLKVLVGKRVKKQLLSVVQARRRSRQE